jgi:hypothetical protein
VAKTDVKSAAVTSDRLQPPSASAPDKPASAAPAPVAKSEDTASAKEDTAAAKTEHAATRAVDPNREVPHRRTQRKSSDDRRFSERKRRQDEDARQQDLDAAASVVRQMPRGTTVGQVVERDDSPRFARSRHFEMFDDDGPPRMVSEPPPRFFGLFGD